MQKIGILIASCVACALTATGVALQAPADEVAQAVPATDRSQLVSRDTERLDDATSTPTPTPSASESPAAVAAPAPAPVISWTPKPKPSLTPTAKKTAAASDPAQPAAGVAPATGNSCTASYYDEPQMTASGERFNPSAMTAAHKTLPLGSRVKVTNPRTGATVIVRINDRGPYVGGRCLDLSRAAFAAIGNLGSGTMTVAWQIV